MDRRGYHHGRYHDMLPSQSSLSTDTSLLPICGSSSPLASGRTAGATGEDAEADFDALFADLSSPEPGDEEDVAAESAAFLVPVLGLPVEPTPVSAHPDLNPTLSSSAGTAPEEGTAEAGEATEEIGCWSSATGSWRRREMAALPEGRSEAAAGVPAGTQANAEQPVKSVMHGSRFMETPAPAPDVPPPAAGTWIQAGESASSRSSSLPSQFQSLPVESELDPATFLATTDAAAAHAVRMPEGGWPRRGWTSSASAPAPTEIIGDRAEPVADAASSVAAHRLTPGQDRTVSSESPLRPGMGERPGQTGEKIAARREMLRRGSIGFGEEPDKSFLSAESQDLVKSSRGLGIDVAKPMAAMPATALHVPPTHSVSEYAVHAAAPAAAVAEVAAVVETTESFSTAHEAVEVVLHAVEHVAAREQNSVQLKFSVAGEELAVRVELRADEVRTTFRTDSAELRAALTHEWQQVAGTASVDRPVRIAPAVFAPSEQSAFDASAGDTSSRERQAGTRRQEIEPAIAALRGRSGSPVATPTLSSSAALPVRSGGSHRLHTLA